MNISVAGFSVHGLLAEKKLDIYTYLEACRYRYDLRTADIWNGLLPDIDTATLRKVKGELDARELTLVNYHVDGVHVWEDDADARQKNRHNALAHLRAAAVLGAKTVRFDTGGTIVAMNSEQTATLIETYAEYARIAHDHGFRVGPETHWGFSLRLDNMLAIAHGVSHPAYGVLLHIGHWEDGDPDAGDAGIAPFAMHTHVDAATTFGANLAQKMDMLLHAGYTGAWGVEHHSGRNEYAEIAAQIAQVRRVLSRKSAENAEMVAAIGGVTLNPLLTAEQEAQA